MVVDLADNGEDCSGPNHLLFSKALKSELFCWRFFSFSYS